MRKLCLLLLALVMTGCGYGSRKYNPGMQGGGAGGAAPTISTLAPSSTTHGGAAFTLTVNGSNFAADAVVYLNGMAHATMYVTGNQVAAAISAADIANPATLPVYVRSGGQNSNLVNFVVH